MAKLKIESIGPNFGAVVVKAPTPFGEPVDVKFEVRFMTKTQLAEMEAAHYALLDQLMHDMNAESKMEELILQGCRKDMDVQVSRLKDMATGWDLDDEFNEANIRRLVDRVPTIGMLLFEGYAAKYRKERQGN